VLTGVAGGIAARLDIPAWVVRVAFIVLAFGGGLGVALYIAGWLLIPSETDPEPIARNFLVKIQDGSGWMGIALVGLGVLIVVSSVDFIRGDLAVAVFLGVIGVMLYRGELGGNAETPTSEEVPTERSAVTTTPATTAGFSEQPSGPTPPLPPASTPTPPEPRKPPQPQRPPSILGRLTIALALIATGVMAFFDYAMDSFDPTPRHYLGLALGVIGVALMIGSVLGRARGLIFVGIVLAPWLVLSPLAEFDLNSGIGERQVQPTALSEIEPRYEMAIGELVIDLRQVDFAGQTVELDASLGIGSLRVLLPDDVGVEVDAEVGIGEASVFGARRSGFARDLDVTRPGAGMLVLDVQTLVGEVRVSTSAATSRTSSSDFAVDLVIDDVSQLESLYDIAAGEIRLDLSSLVLDQPRTVRVSNNVGRIHVIVGDRSTTTINAHTDLGQVVLYGVEQSGIGTTVTSSATGRALLTLDLDLNSGEIVVEEG
jgi:phage shock protein PspC (stress-responsive transcriptional regulator)/predicted membrane protein